MFFHKFPLSGPESLDIMFRSRFLMMRFVNGDFGACFFLLFLSSGKLDNSLINMELFVSILKE